jgi:hypothetical protein
MDMWLPRKSCVMTRWTAWLRHFVVALVVSVMCLCLLSQVLEAFKTEVGEVPYLMKADVDAAFRRIPVKPDERWMCGIAFMVDGQVLQSLLLVLALPLLTLCLRSGGRSIWQRRLVLLDQCTVGSVLVRLLRTLHGY